MFLQLLFYFPFIFKKKKKKTRAPAWVKNSKVMLQLPHYLSFLLGKGGNPYTSNPIKNFKILQSALSDQPLQCTS